MLDGLDLGGDTKTKTGGGRSAASKAADEAERRREAIEDGLRSSEQSLAVMRQELKVSEAASELMRQQEELELSRLQINQDYDSRMRDALKNELSEQQKINIELERGVALRKASIDTQRAMMDSAQSDFTDFFKQQPEYAKMFNDELSTTDQLLKGAYETVANGLTSAIRGLIDGTKSWRDVLSDITGQLGSMLLQMGTKALGVGLGVPGFADGGRPMVGNVSLVGENGPEFFVPDSPGRVMSNEQSQAAMATYSPANESMAPAGPMTSTINYNGPTLEFDSTLYIPRSEAPNLVAAGAKQGEQRALNRLRQSRSTRNKLGM